LALFLLDGACWCRVETEEEERGEGVEREPSSSTGGEPSSSTGGEPSSSTPRFRFFTPREVANIHGKPAHFSFPEGVTLKQRCVHKPNSRVVR
jgi:site-specific DNA-cytosine methylase